jgi:nitrite reductase (NO-forming)
MLKYIIFEMISAIVGVVAIIIILVQIYKSGHLVSFFKRRLVYIPLALFIVAFFTGLLANRTYPPDFAMPAFTHSHAPGGLPPSIPFSNIVNFFTHENRFEKIADIGANPNTVPALPQAPDQDGIVRIRLTAKEVISEIASGVYFNYWTYNGQVPGPMLRVKEGDTVEVILVITI